MVGLQRSLSVQISEVFSGMLSRQNSQNEIHYYSGDVNDTKNEWWNQQMLIKNTPYNCSKNAHHHSSGNNLLSRTESIQKPFGKIYYTVSLECKLSLGGIVNTNY